MILLPQVISLSPDIHVLYIAVALIILWSRVDQVSLVVDHVLDGFVGEYVIVQGVVAHLLKNMRIRLALKAQQPVASAVLRLGVFRSLEHHGKEPG